MDFGVSKNWHLPVITSEGLALQFRMEFFNVFNHPQFSGVINNNVVGVGAFGTDNPAPNASREIQYTLKLSF